MGNTSGRDRKTAGAATLGLLSVVGLALVTGGCSDDGQSRAGTGGAGGTATGGTSGQTGGASGTGGVGAPAPAGGAGGGGRTGTTGGTGGGTAVSTGGAGGTTSTGTGGMGGRAAAGAGGSGGTGGSASPGGSGGRAGQDAGVDAAADVRPATSADAGVAQSIAGFRWEVPCKSNAFVTEELCPADRMLTQMRTFGGDPNVTYEVEVRLRGIIEPHTFTALDGKRLSTVTPAPYMVDSTAAKPDDIPYALFMIDVPQPKVTYYFNAFHTIDGEFHHQLLPVDYTVKLKIQGGSMLRMAYTDGNTEQVANFKRVVVPGIPPAPQPYNGQFLQLDVVSVSP